MKKLILSVVIILVGLSVLFGQEEGYNVWLIVQGEEAYFYQTTDIEEVQDMCNKFIEGMHLDVEEALEHSQAIDVLVDDKNMVVEKVEFKEKKRNGKYKTKRIKPDKNDRNDPKV